MPKTLYVIDGHYQIYRAFYAPFRELTSPSGEPTRATFVFCQVLFGLLRDRKPDYVVMVMDVSDETTFRREIDPNYKAQREPAPETLHVQADRIMEIVKTLGVPLHAIPGFEADDLMATIAKQLADEDLDVFLVSKDKDLEQLITDRVHLYDAATGDVLDAAVLQERKGYTPQQAVEIQSLTGDTTDNVPGVPGVGIKTAVKLISRYGSAQRVIAHADELTPKMAERVRAYAGQLPKTRELVTLRDNVPLELAPESGSPDCFHFAALRPIFDELGFHRLRDQLDAMIARYPGDRAQDNPMTAVAATDQSAATPTPSQTGRYLKIDLIEALETFARNLSAQPAFAFDTETTGLLAMASDVVGMSFCWQAGEAYYLPLRAAMGNVLPLERVVALLKPVFEDESIAKIGQNLKFDALVLRTIGIRVANLAFDTMIASFLLDPLARSHSLDALARRYFDHTMIPITDLIGKGRNQITMDLVDVDQVCEYAAEDADFTWRVYEVLAEKMAGSHVEPLFRDTEMPLVSVLVEMEHHGVTLDVHQLADLGDSIADRLIALTKEVHRAAGHEFNIDSTQQLANVLFDEQGLGVVRKTKTGRSTDAATLQALADSTENVIPGLVLEYRELAKLRSTYIETLPKMVCARTGRVHASFDQTGAVTGRLASRDPNLQNIPVRTEMGRQIRRAFIARDSDHVILTADYSQVELRLLAHFCRDEGLIEAFRTGQDIHRTVAAEVNGIAPDAVTQPQRSAAKAVNFGIIYGQSAFGLARSLGIPVGDARQFIDRYFDRFPGIRVFIDECIAKARREGYAETILGRRRPIEELQSRNRQQVALGERLAVNTVVQGSAADLIKRAMIEIHSSITSAKLSARMLIQVHDELVFEVPRGCVEREAGTIRAKMEGAIDLAVPVVVDTAWADNWADAK